MKMIEDLTPSEFLRRCDSGELWQLLDVREAWEIEIASIEQTIDIPMAEIPSRVAELDASLPVAVVCHSGGRSAQVANYLVQSGFERVANIVGGIDAWSLQIDDSVSRY
jgi:rhodanese-related sulfurtransferase